jgi:DNA polymerase-3 subunit gamma/tau
MVLNGFAEFMRNLLICKDERVAGLLEVVESFRTRYAEAAKKVDPAYIISALNLLNEAEIGFRAARNKRLHVELALIRLCYLSQALVVTANSTGVSKKKLVEGTKAIAFKAIQPLALPQVSATDVAEVPEPLPPPRQEAKLIIETPPARQELQNPELVEERTETYQPPEKKQPANTRLSSLGALRQKIAADCGQQTEADKPLEMTTLKAAWKKFIHYLKEQKRPAWQSYELAELSIKDDTCFEVIVHNRINEKFIELERKEAGEFFQKELCNRLLQFSITLVESPKDETVTAAPLTAKDQYLKLVEMYPLVKELKDRLRLELDY